MSPTCALLTKSSRKPSRTRWDPSLWRRQAGNRKQANENCRLLLWLRNAYFASGPACGGYGSFSRRKIAENEIGKVTGTVASVAPEVVLPLLLRRNGAR